MQSRRDQTRPDRQRDRFLAVVVLQSQVLGKVYGDLDAATNLEPVTRHFTGRVGLLGREGNGKAQQVAIAAYAQRERSTDRLCPERLTEGKYHQTSSQVAKVL